MPRPKWLEDPALVNFVAEGAVLKKARLRALEADTTLAKILRAAMLDFTRGRDYQVEETTDIVQSQHYNFYVERSVLKEARHRSIDEDTPLAHILRAAVLEYANGGD